jgi:hypothetical protein
LVNVSSTLQESLQAAEMRPTAFVELRGILLDPAVDCGVIHVTPFERMLMVHEGNSSVLLDEEQSLPDHRFFATQPSERLTGTPWAGSWERTAA